MFGSDELESVPMERFISYPYPDAILYSDLGGVITRGTSWHLFRVVKFVSDCTRDICG